jgi:urease accessory protein UreH
MLSGTTGTAANGDWTLAKTKRHHRDERVTMKRIHSSKRIHSKNALTSVEKLAKDNNEPKLILS